MISNLTDYFESKLNISDNAINSQSHLNEAQSVEDNLLVTHLPPEIIAHIFAYLKALDLINVGHTCSSLRDMASSFHLWKPFTATLKFNGGKVGRAAWLHFQGLLRHINADPLFCPTKRKQYLGEHVEIDGLHLLNAVKEKQQAQIWNAVTGQLLSTLEDVKDQDSMAIGGDFVAGAWDKSLEIWEISTGKKRQLLGHDAFIKKVLISDGYLISQDARQTVKVWDLKAKELLLTLQDCQALIGSIAVEGNKLALGTSTGAIEVWDLKNGTLLHLLKEHAAPVSKIAMSGNKIVSAAGDKTLIWEASALLHVLEKDLKGEGASALIVYGNTIISAIPQNDVCLWDLASGQLLATLACYEKISALTATADKVIAFSAQDGCQALVWELKMP